MTPAFVSLDSPAALAGLVGLVVVLLMFDLAVFARGREPSFREGAVWSAGWLVLSLLVALPLLALSGSEAAINYTTVYLIERSLSLDNLFVFLLLFAYFGVPLRHRARLLFWGIVFALAMRGVAILAGVTLIERFHFVIYVLGATLLILAYRILRGVEEGFDPDSNLLVRLARRLFPVTHGYREGHWFRREDGRLHATPLFLAFVALGAADVAFAVDSIPAAFAITRDSAVIWMGNAFALLGLRALFVLVEGLISRFRYLDQTIAVVLALVAVKLLIEDLVKVGPVASLIGVAVAFAVGIGASLWADRRDPDSEAKRAARGGRVQAADGPDGA
ncbi:MAG: tellurite resistance protein TerC [Solirubrobacteraceae bacterium]|nr:tellurite resistance protein TerC [Solirubrobacteraceae bacterium]